MKKKMMMTLMSGICTVCAMAQDYIYLTFQTADEAKSIAIDNRLTLTVGSDGILTVDGQSFKLSDLSSMYFTESPIELVTIGETGWGTHYSDNALDYPSADGLTTYQTQFDHASGSFSLIAWTDAVPAGSGILLSGESGSYRVPVTSSAPALTANDLSGTASDLTVPSNGYYVLAKIGDGSVGFRQVSPGVNIPAGKAYYRPTTATSRDYYLIDDGATGLERVTTTSDDGSAVYYDLQGRRVPYPQKGIYIRNGKKVMIK